MSQQFQAYLLRIPLQLPSQLYQNVIYLLCDSLHNLPYPHFLRSFCRAGSWCLESGSLSRSLFRDAAMQYVGLCPIEEPFPASLVGGWARAKIRMSQRTRFIIPKRGRKTKKWLISSRTWKPPTRPPWAVRRPSSTDPWRSLPAPVRSLMDAYNVWSTGPRVRAP